MKGSRACVGGVVTWLQPFWSGVRISKRSRVSSLLQNVQTLFGPNLLTVQLVPEFFPVGKSGRGVKLPTHLRILPRLRMSGIVPLLPLYACMVWTRHLYLYLSKKDFKIRWKCLNKLLFCNVCGSQDGDYKSC